HDGTTLVEQGLDALLREKSNRAIVIAASNSYEDGIHAEINVPANGNINLIWRAPESEFGHEVEMWLPKVARVAIELVAPDGTSLGMAEPGTNLPIGTNQDVVVFIANRINEPNNGDNSVGIFIAGGIPAGDWTVVLHSRVAAPFSCHAWIERYDSAQSSF